MVDPMFFLSTVFPIFFESISNVFFPDFSLATMGQLLLKSEGSRFLRKITASLMVVGRALWPKNEVLDVSLKILLLRFAWDEHKRKFLFLYWFPVTFIAGTILIQKRFSQSNRGFLDQHYI